MLKPGHSRVTGRSDDIPLLMPRVQARMHGRDVGLFDRFAPVYDRVMPGADSEALQRGFEMAERDVDGVVDVGGGSGRGARALGVEERLVVDPALGMLAQARRHNLDAVRGDGAALPVAADSVDGVLVVDALHHMHDQQGVVEEAYRVLAPGGVLVIAEFDPTTIRGRLLEIAEVVVGFDSTFLPPDELGRTMQSVGFDTQIPVSGFGYTIAGIKPAGD